VWIRPPREQRRGFAERWHDPVVVGHGERRADLRGFLPDGRRVRSEFAASLERDRPLVESSGSFHEFVQFEQLVVAQRRCQILVDLTVF